MDLDLTPTPTKSGEDTEIDTPPRAHAQPLSYSTTKSHHHRHQTPPEAAAVYKECMKNHAAAIGGHAVDGCGEFMTSLNSLRCAACGCHRNFHRRESAAITPPFLDFRRPPLLLQHRTTSLSTSPPPPQPQPYTLQFGPQTFLTLNSAAEKDHHQAPVTPLSESPAGRKRFRTKFSQDQKDKMHSFSEKLGWKLQKCTENEVAEFCKDIGVARGVLKVWMHNNKNTIGKKINGATISPINCDGHNFQIVDNGSGGGDLFHRSSNGSTNSSST